MQITWNENNKRLILKVHTKYVVAVRMTGHELVFGALKEQTELHLKSSNDEKALMKHLATP